MHPSNLVNLALNRFEWYNPRPPPANPAATPAGAYKNVYNNPQALPQALPPPLTEWQPIGTPQEQFYRPSQYEQGRGFFKTLD